VRGWAGNYITKQSLRRISYQPQEADMLQGKHALTKRKRKALPALGVAGLSLTLASAASAAAIAGQTAEALTRNATTLHEISLSEEEISDVSLATLHVFDNERAAVSPRGARFAAGGCGGGCGGCGSCSSSSDYEAPTTWGNVGTLPVSPTRKAVRTPKRKR
jgi:hypothetical protein